MNMESQSINKYWKAANYLTVAFMYLKNNIFLTEEFSVSDMKDYPTGHWGTSPGINFIFAHLNRFICYTKKQIQLVVGPGHAGNALLANLLIEDSLKEYYVIDSKEKSFNFDAELVNKLMTKIRTENSPFFPGLIYDGGELGYSLPVAFGSVLDNPNLLSVCIIGDGEFETGTIASSWRCKDYLDRSSGFVLPIIHLNGFRMGSRSIISYYDDEDIMLYFKSMGYEAKIVDFNHEKMINALDWADDMYKKIKNGEYNVWPVLVLKTLKGYSAPNIEGTSGSHKDPLKRFNKRERFEYLHGWLRSYQPTELFDDNGFFHEDILRIIPEDKFKIGRILESYSHSKLNIPEANQFSLSLDDMESKYSTITILTDYLLEIIQKNADIFRIMSPDELQSNLLGKLISICDVNSVNYTSNSRVMEILNENICQAWLQGYILTGRNAVMISYEAFMPIITSMVSQYAKWIYQSKKVSWRKDISSATYILTSLWESNTYSHQNPEFISNMLGSQHEFVRIYMPIDANTLLSSTYQCLSSENQINTIIVSKQNMPQFLNIENANLCVEKGIVNWDYFYDNNETIDIILAAAGDYSIRETMEGLKIIQQYISQINIRVISILELTVIGANAIYPHAMNEDDFRHFFTSASPVVFCFHGYAAAIKALLFDRIELSRISIIGYNNRSVTSTNDLNKMILNGNSRYNIVIEACKLIKDKLSIQLFSTIQTDMYKQIQEQIKDYEV